MRLDPSYLQFITPEELRVLVAIEMGMKNHEFVPAQLIHGIANLKTGDAYKILRQLLKLKFICHVSKKYDGYKLNYQGYDYLALQTFIKRGVIKSVVGKIGVGKESDVYKCLTPQGTEVVLKFARLGRTSFRTIKSNRDYIKNRTGYNWLYLSRLSTASEFSFMQVLHKHGFPTPRPIDCNRHGIVMSLVDGVTMCHLKELGHCERVFKNCLALIEKFAEYGLIHGDFNEFNLMIGEDSTITVIDFPQCVSVNHLNAVDYFDRDVECIYTFFERMRSKSLDCEENGSFDPSATPMLNLKDIEVKHNLDAEVKASGYYDKNNFSEIDLKRYEEYQQLNRKMRRGEELVEEYDSEEEDQFLAEVEEGTEVEIKDPQLEVSDLAKTLEEELKGIEPIVTKKEAPEGQESSSGDEEDDEVQERFKGMTDYQIRQVLKKEKEDRRIKRKEEEKNTSEFIKEIVRKKPKAHKRLTQNKNKGLIKVHPEDCVL